MNRGDVVLIFSKFWCEEWNNQLLHGLEKGNLNSEQNSLTSLSGENVRCMDSVGISSWFFSLSRTEQCTVKMQSRLFETMIAPAKWSLAEETLFYRSSISRRLRRQPHSLQESVAGDIDTWETWNWKCWGAFTYATSSASWSAKTQIPVFDE